MGLAWKIAWKWSQKTGLPYEDLEGIAMIGLVRGCRKYDPELINPDSGRPFAVSSRVCPFIHGELLHWFRDHPYAIKFPNSWRENYGKVMRLLEQQKPLSEISKATGIPARELEEMVEAMVTPGQLNDEITASSTQPELDLAGPLLEIVALAYADMHVADRHALSVWIDATKGAFPSGPHQQHEKRCLRLLSGRKLPQLRTVELVNLPEVRRSRTAQRRRLEELVQGSLFHLQA